MKKQAVLILFLVTLCGMSSCNLPVPPDAGQVGQDVSQRYLTISALLTETAQGTAVPAVEGAVQHVTQTVQGTSLAIYTQTMMETSTTPQLIEQTREPMNQPAPAVPCDIAQAGHPIDITVPDDTHFYPGEYFSKTWRLVNGGSCAWTRDYGVVWFSGDNLGIYQAQTFLSDVQPGGSVEVTVEMLAPQRPGMYQSNWKLRNSRGELFGIGPNGDSPFWVRIYVVPVDTPTATPTFPVATPTPPVFASGSLVLQLDEGVDLDSGQVDLPENSDLVFIQPEEKGFIIVPENDARLVLFGTGAPGFQDCSLAELSGDPVDLQQIPVGSYLCFRTTQGLPGRIYLANIDPEEKKIDFDFVTWVVP